MEFTVGIWIKALAYLAVALLLPFGGYIVVKRGVVRPYIIIVSVIVSVLVAFCGINYGRGAVHPEIEHVHAQFKYSSTSAQVLGHKYYFVDHNGNNYDLTMDVVTDRKLLKGRELKKKAYYNVGYDKHSKVITSIKRLK